MYNLIFILAYVGTKFYYCIIDETCDAYSVWLNFNYIRMSSIEISNFILSLVKQLPFKPVMIVSIFN